MSDPVIDSENTFLQSFYERDDMPWEFYHSYPYRLITSRNNFLAKIAIKKSSFSFNIKRSPLDFKLGYHYG